SGHIRGKAIVLDATTGLEGMRYLLPPGTEASKPQDVGTVVVVASSSVSVGSYTGGASGAAKVIIWTVTVIDWPKRDVGAGRRFRGGPPPQVIVTTVGNSGGGASGEAPTAETQAWLKAMSRKKL